MSRVGRRRLLLAAGALLVAPLAAHAQQPAKTHRIGFLLIRSRPTLSNPEVYEFVQGMRDLGYVEGKNLAIEWRFADGDLERVPTLAAELVRLKVEVIVAPNTPSTLAVQRVSRAIPIVCVSCSDPVRTGITASLAHPDGNATGPSMMGREAAQKNLELLKTMLPALSRVAVLVNPDNAGNLNGLKGFQEAALHLGVEVLPVEARTLGEIERGLAAIARERVDAVSVIVDSLFIVHRSRIIELVARSRLPSSFYTREDVEAGGLMSYGQKLPEFYRHAATYVDRILKGAKPAELPIEQLTKIYFVINLRTAKALGITIPQELLLRADELIQ